MAWLALCDRHERRLSLHGLGIDRAAAPRHRDDPRTLLTRGSIMFETRLSADGRPQVLFGFRAAHPWQRSLVFQAIPGGGIAMVQVQDRAITHAAIQHRNSGRTDVVRITYAWDSCARWGRLTLEKPEDATTTTVSIEAPRPLSLEDCRDLMLGRGDHSFAPDMIFAALSDEIEATGPMPSLLPATPLATPQGYRSADSLRRGDTVHTRGAGIVPVLGTVGRSVPARGSYAPVRLRAPYFGLQQDIVVAPDQRLLIDGPEVEYLFGQEAVLTPARHLVNGFAAMEEPCGPVIRYSQLVLPCHETLIAAGTALESLYIGRIRRNPDQLHASLLHGMNRSTLPEHGRPAHHVLRWYDAIHLARRRAA